VEQDRSLLHGETCPLFESPGSQEKVEVILFKQTHTLFSGANLFWQQSFSADVLNLVHS
jgi:hypothetical protein